MPDPNDRPTASEIRDIASHGGIIDPDDLRGLIRDLAAIVAEQQRQIEWMKAQAEVPSTYEQVAEHMQAVHDVCVKANKPDFLMERYAFLRAEGAAAERERIRKIAEGLQSKRVATASGDYNDGRYNAYLDIISSTQPDGPAPEGEKAEERHIHEETPITPEYTHVRSEWVFNVKGLEQHDNQVREEERREILEMLGTDDKSLPPAMRGIETAMGAVRYFRAAIRARGTK